MSATARRIEKTNMKRQQKMNQSAETAVYVPAKLRMKLSGTLFSSLSMPRPSNTSELPIKVKIAIAQRMMRISVRFSKFSVEDNPTHLDREFLLRKM